MISFLDGIVSHLKKQAGPASVELKSEEELTKFIGDRDASVVGEHGFSLFLLSLLLIFVFLKDSLKLKRNGA